MIATLCLRCVFLSLTTGPKGFRHMVADPSVVIMIEMVFPDQTNHYGTLFGGHALRLMDKAAFVAASRYARRTVVTASSERVDFKSAVHHGNLIELHAAVVSTGRSSMTVAVQLFAEDLLSGERTLCAEGRFILVALDEEGRPVPVKTFPANTPIASKES